MNIAIVGKEYRLKANDNNLHFFINYTRLNELVVLKSSIKLIDLNRSLLKSDSSRVDKIYFIEWENTLSLLFKFQRVIVQSFLTDNHKTSSYHH